MKEVRWTETAKKSLQEASDFIIELWGYYQCFSGLTSKDQSVSGLEITPSDYWFKNQKVSGSIFAYFVLPYLDR